MYYQGLIHRYRQRLPLADDVQAISLLEGNTPLIPLRTIAPTVEAYVKFEGLNPTGSFKDRGMTVAVTHAVSQGSKAIVCASTGNTSASAAAYAASVGIKAFVLIPDGKIAMGKLAQAMMHGAKVIQIQGNFDDGMQLVKELAEKAPISLVNSVNPYRIQGQKTAAFEIIDSLGDAPDYHCIPVGNAGNITAYWLGYNEYANDKQASKTPVMCGYQASGAAPIIHGQKVESPETIATAIRIGNPQSWQQAVEAQQQSAGWFDHFSDEDILATQRLLAQQEGIFCEPASAISVAGMLRDINTGKIPAASRIVCTLTGHGLKDPKIAIEQCTTPQQKVAATYQAVSDIILQDL